jgi:hypothetical protein
MFALYPFYIGFGIAVHKMYEVTSCGMHAWYAHANIIRTNHNHANEDMDTYETHANKFAALST